MTSSRGEHGTALLHTNSIFPPSSLHIALVFFPHPSEKGTRHYGTQNSKRQHDLPQREAGPEGAEPGAQIPQPHRPAGPQRGGQIHPDEAAGGGPDAHRGEYPGGRDAAG